MTTLQLLNRWGQDSGDSLAQLRSTLDNAEDAGVARLALRALLARGEPVAAGLRHAYNRARNLSAQLQYALVATSSEPTA